MWVWLCGCGRENVRIFPGSAPEKHEKAFFSLGALLTIELQSCCYLVLLLSGIDHAVT